jgi:hypothetical protein
MLRTFIQVLALLLIFTSSYFLIKGVLVSSPKVIADLVSTRVGYSLSLAQNFCHQRADTIIGFILLICGSLLQGINLLWQLRIKDFGVNMTGAILAAILTVVIFFGAYKASDMLYKSHYRHVESILKSEEETSR